MSLEKILKKITGDAKEDAQRIIGESRQKAKEIKEAASREALVLEEALLKEEQRKGRLEASRIVTQARLERKISILSCKKKLIDETLNRAFQKDTIGEISLTRKIIFKDGEKEEFLDEKKLREELRPKLESYILKALKI